MSTREIYWRLGAKLSECLDRCAAPARRQPVPHHRILSDHTAGLSGNGGVIGSHWAEPGQIPPDAVRWQARADAAGDKIRQNRLTLFDLEDHDLGGRIDWNYEYKARKHAPTCFSADVDYRDHRLTGDCKFVWEPNRHQHLVVLGRAYRLTGRLEYATTVIRHLESWIEQCPYGTGMNWRSPLELAIRLINWVWALELIRPANVVQPALAERLISSVYRHLWEISRKYSRFSSANNHLIGEAAGVFIGSSYFHGLKKAGRWQQESRAILLREILSQTHADGGTREQALGYHLFVLEFFLLAGLVARNAGVDFPAEYWGRLERMLEFVAVFAEGGGTLPMFGDADDGYVLDLGSRACAADLLAVGSLVLGRPDLLTQDVGNSEAAFWLVNPAARSGVVKPAAASRRLGSIAFPESGYYLLQYGDTCGPDRISVTFDCGELGFGPLAAHGHADALAITLRAHDEDLFIDPGTYDYFTYPKWRAYFRSTRAHNTVIVDDADQSEMLGPFLWGHRAAVRCLRWEPTDSGGTVAGEHDGYCRLPNGVHHQRTVSLDGPERELLVRDELRGGGHHTATVAFHLAAHCTVESVEGAVVSVRCNGGRVMSIQLDPRLRVEVVRGREEPILGWASRGYHRKVPSATIVGRCEWTDIAELPTRVTLP